MLLNELLKAIQPVEVAGDSNIEITGVNIDSRLVEAGQLFMAMRGTQADGHAYIPAAIAKGAIAILCEDMPEEPVAGITYVRVKDSEDAVGKIATTFYGDPTSKLELVGVTGTNGKTTIATLLYNTFRYFGYKVGLISTVCNYIDDEPIPTEHTTPDPITLNCLLGRMADEGCKYRVAQSFRYFHAGAAYGFLIYLHDDAVRRDERKLYLFSCLLEKFFQLVVLAKHPAVDDFLQFIRILTEDGVNERQYGSVSLCSQFVCLFEIAVDKSFHFRTDRDIFVLSFHVFHTVPSDRE